MNVYFNLDCLRKEFEENLDESNLHCTLPWIESMRGSLNYTEDEKPTCKTLEDYGHVDLVGYDFAFYASVFGHGKCLGILQIHLLMKV